MPTDDREEPAGGRASPRHQSVRDGNVRNPPFMRDEEFQDENVRKTFSRGNIEVDQQPDRDRFGAILRDAEERYDRRVRLRAYRQPIILILATTFVTYLAAGNWFTQIWSLIASHIR
jgi:hypothetical protein